MKTIEFIKSLQGKTKVDNLFEMSANEYFETIAGKKTIYFLPKKVTVIDERTWKFTRFYNFNYFKYFRVYFFKNLC